ncbi:MAG: hypothetical protein ABFS17_09100 [Chloroflexota bacterium]
MGRVSKSLSKLLDSLSESLSQRKGLVPLIGLGLVVLNLVLEFILPGTFLTRTDLFLHLGVLAAIFGLILAQAL